MKKTCNRCRALHALSGESPSCELGYAIDTKTWAPLEDCPKPLTWENFIICRGQRGKFLHKQRLRSAVDIIRDMEPEAGVTADGKAFTKEENAAALETAIHRIEQLLD